MRVFVTGVNGYSGAVLTPILMPCGMEVRRLDVGYCRDGWLFSDHGGIPVQPLTIIKELGHITTADLEGRDAVVHLAEPSNDPLGENNARRVGIRDGARQLYALFERIQKSLETYASVPSHAYGSSSICRKLSKSTKNSAGAGLQFEPLPIEGAVFVKSEANRDERGVFARTYCARESAAIELPTTQRATVFA
jgi:hypothetical protein